jgi:broad specificity polyphosphatase/5'/3'-nucleotidase SurE
MMMASMLRAFFSGTLLKEYGNVTVVAPCSPCRVSGHAITMRNPVFMEENRYF